MSQLRTSDQWLSDLSQGEGIEDLTQFILGGLRKSLSKRASINEADLEDFAQDACFKVLESLSSFQGKSRFTTWAMSIAIRTAFTQMRRRRWKDVSIEDLDLPEPQTGPAENPDGTTERRELVDVLRSAIDTDLTEKQRTLILGELAGMPAAVLVERLQTNPNALYKLYHDARKRLHLALAKAGFQDSEVRTLLSGSTSRS